MALVDPTPDHFRRRGAEADPEKPPVMTEAEQGLRNRNMIVAKDGSLRFLPPRGVAYSEDQLAKIVAYMASENTKRMLARLNHPNQPT